ncbi:ATP-binding protein [bacterium]|nr:ATP-binding protein [bacterium]
MSEPTVGTLFRRVLLVEDDPSHRLLIQRALEPLVETLRLSRTVGDAMEQLQSEPYDLVITDLSLPDSDGVSHVRDFQRPQPGLPVVVLSVTTRIEKVVSAMRFGAKDFVIKSFDSDFRELLRLSLARVFSALQVEEERAKLQRAIENSDDGLALLNRDGAIRYANRAYEIFAKRCGGDVQQLTTVLSERISNREMLREQLEKRLFTLRAGGVWNAEVVISGAEFRAYGLTLSGLERLRGEELSPDQSVEEDELVVWVRDITEMKRRERFQRELLSTTTHDLKGPLGAVITGSELVGDLIKGQEKASQILLRVKSAAHGVVHLIDEFLSARRIEDGSLILKPARHSVRDLFEEIQASYETIADSRKISLTVEVSGEDQVELDKIGFLRVMGNLLSNALKFTKSGGEVQVRVRADEERNLHVTVTDTGSGIEPAELSRIFNRYARLDQHQEVAGTGLGLFVVKSIIDAHGGSIQVDSELGSGTTFTLFFPGAPPVNERGELISLVLSDEERPEAAGRA